MDVAPDRLALRSGDTDDLECPDDSLAPRVTAFEVVEGVVHSRSEVRRLEALSEIQGRLATQELVNFLLGCPDGEENRQVITEWTETWTSRAHSAAETLFESLEQQLPEPGLCGQANAAAGEETQRVGAHLLGVVDVNT